MRNKEGTTDTQCPEEGLDTRQTKSMDDTYTTLCGLPCHLHKDILLDGELLTENFCLHHPIK
jgi:hypothetical protein